MLGNLLPITLFLFLASEDIAGDGNPSWHTATEHAIWTATHSLSYSNGHQGVGGNGNILIALPLTEDTDQWAATHNIGSFNAINASTS